MISGGLGDFAGSLRMISGGCFLGCNPKMMLLSLGSTGAYTRNLMGKSHVSNGFGGCHLQRSTFHRGIGDGCMMDNLMQDLCTHVHPKSLTKDKPNGGCVRRRVTRMAWCTRPSAEGAKGSSMVYRPQSPLGVGSDLFPVASPIAPVSSPWRSRRSAS